MELKVAIDLLKAGVSFANSSPQQWVELGAGEGLFSKALSTLLPAHSTILAIDKNKKALTKIPDTIESIHIVKLAGDFRSVLSNSELFDGIVMANALHFVAQPSQFLTLLRERLTTFGRVILVEYEMDTPNPWVPYPISFNALKKLAEQSGFSDVQQMAETRSAYNRAMIYSAVLRK